MTIPDLIEDESFALFFERWRCEGRLAFELVDEGFFHTLMSMLYSFSEAGRQGGMAALHERAPAAQGEGVDVDIIGLTMRTAFYGVLSENLCKARESFNQDDRKQCQWHLEECVLSGRDLRNPKVIAMAGMLVCLLGTTEKNCGYWRETADACAALGDEEGARRCQQAFEGQRDATSAPPGSAAPTSRPAPAPASEYSCLATAAGEIAAYLARGAEPRGFRLVLVAGGSCSGKSTFARQLRQSLDAHGVRANVLSQDWFFRDLTDGHFPRDPHDRPIADVPGAYHLTELVDALLAASRGDAIECPVYDMASNRRRAGQTQSLPTASVCIVEGLHVITELGAMRAGSLRVYVTAPDAVRLARRQARDRRFDVSSEIVARAWAERIAPAYAPYHQTQRAAADVVVLNHFERAERAERT